MNFRKTIKYFYRQPSSYKHWYLAAFIGIFSLSAFCSGEDDAFYDPAIYKLPDSLTVIDHDFTEQHLKEYKTRKLADSLVLFARQLQGKPYHWGGKGPKGFDCSGFVAYVYNAFGFPLNGSSRSQNQQGQQVSLEKVKKGDVLFFTGTNPKNRQVGHVGIVVSEPDEEIRFVHSSTNKGVVVSPLKGYYATRLLEAKRMLDHNSISMRQ